MTWTADKMGRKGGSQTSDKKAKAARLNWAKAVAGIKSKAIRKGTDLQVTKRLVD